MIYLKQSTASQEIALGVFVDQTDGFTAETGLTIANTDIKLWKTGATTLADKNSGGATHIAGGIYYAVLDATDTATLGPMTVFVHVSGARPVIVPCCVLAANIYDSLVGGGDYLDIAVAELSAASIDSIIDEVVEGTTTMRQMLRGFASALLSKVSGAGSATVTFRDIGDTKNRIVATVDSSGNRSAITLTLT